VFCESSHSQVSEREVLKPLPGVQRLSLGSVRTELHPGLCTSLHTLLPHHVKPVHYLGFIYCQVLPPGNFYLSLRVLICPAWSLVLLACSAELMSSVHVQLVALGSHFLEVRGGEVSGLVKQLIVSY
jgi:hypothetical protein